MSENILDKEISVIDFSKGIRAEEVYGNDSILQDQINNERLSTAGYGIDSGLSMSISQDDDFKIIITNGTSVNEKGVVAYLKGAELQIEKPILSTVREYLYASEDGMIILNNLPYSPNRDMPAEFCKLKNYGISIHYEDDINSEPLQIISVDGKTIYAKISDPTVRVMVEYFTTNDRIDTIYIDKDYDIKVAMGMTSSSPSIYTPQEYLYILGYAYVDHDYYDADLNQEIARMTIKVNTNCRRNIYTDENNVLYIGGIPYDELSRIYLSEPENPKENTFWYDLDSNKLMVYRRTDHFNYSNIINLHEEVNQIVNTDVSYTDKEQLSVYVDLLKDDVVRGWRKLDDSEIEYFTDGLKESKQFTIGPELKLGCNIRYSIDKYDGGLYWIPVNDTTSIPAQEYQIWAPNSDGTSFVDYKNGLAIEDMEEIPYNDFQIFLFKPGDIHLHYTPYKNELSILIDQVQLFNDQFIELTASMLLEDAELFSIAQKYGYTQEILKNYADNYKELGLGFKLANKLDEPAFIQANIMHRIADAYLKNKFQRTASFTTEKTVSLSDCISENNIITVKTDTPYCYGENQLDAFINGFHVDKIALVECPEGAELGSFSREFKIDLNKLTYMQPTSSAKITYRILTNIYSYDHIDALFNEAVNGNENLLNLIKTICDVETEHTHPISDIENYENIAMKSDLSSLRAELIELIGQSGGGTPVNNNPSITSFTVTPSSGTFEIGTIINGPFVFKWSIDRNITNQSITDIGTIENSERNYTLSGITISSDKTFTLSVSDDKGSDTKSISFSFKYYRFWGAKEKPTEYTSDWVKELPSKEFASSKAKNTFDVTTGENQYIYYCIPSSWGTPSFNVGGFVGGFELAGTVDYISGDSNTTSYSIWKSDNPNLGTQTIIIK